MENRWYKERHGTMILMANLLRIIAYALLVIALVRWLAPRPTPDVIIVVPAAREAPSAFEHQLAADDVAHYLFRGSSCHTCIALVPSTVVCHRYDDQSGRIEEVAACSLHDGHADCVVADGGRNIGPICAGVRLSWF